ncbi:RNA-guided endonuclease TnpB family protein [Streptomyces sp. NPDC002547]
MTVIKDSCGRYFLSFVVDTEPDILPRLETESGIYLGLSAFAVLSDGTKIHSPRFLRRAEKKLKHLQPELSRKAKGSKNRAKARIKVARQHARVADRRRDWHHKASTQIIRENQAVFVEDLAVSGLGRTRLAKSVYDAGWAAFVGMLEYKAALYGRTLAKAGRAVPSSQICSAADCGTAPSRCTSVSGCAASAAPHDRDHNAARNVLFEGRRIVAAGWAETPNACGAPVRRAHVPTQRVEAGSPRKGQTTQAGSSGLKSREYVKVWQVGHRHRHGAQVVETLAETVMRTAH